MHEQSMNNKTIALSCRYVSEEIATISAGRPKQTAPLHDPETSARAGHECMRLHSKC